MARRWRDYAVALLVAVAWSCAPGPQASESPATEPSTREPASPTPVEESRSPALSSPSLLPTSPPPAITSPTPIAYAQPAGGPGAAVAFDGSTNAIVLFQTRWPQGGIPAAETWTWAGHAWAELHPAHTPSPRSDAGIAYDAVRHNIVLFGGLATPASSGSGLLADTWTWDGSDWTELFPTQSPSPRIAPLVFDPAVGGVVLLGGNLGASGQNSEMWLWNGDTWARMPASLPSGWRLPLRAAYDDATSSVVAVSCVPQSAMTYVFDGTSWHQYPAVGLPCGPAMAYDAKRSVVVAFGGNSGQVSNATWTWDGSHWAQKAPAHSPPPRFVAVASFDANDGEVLIFGGSESFGAQNAVDVTTTWAWDGTDWTHVAG